MGDKKELEDIKTFQEFERYLEGRHSDLGDQLYNEHTSNDDGGPDTDRIIGLVDKYIVWGENLPPTGMFNRASYEDKREFGFLIEWFILNEPIPYLNGGQGMIQDQANHHKLGKLSERERMITALIVRWLGTNIGFGFLENALKRSGYSIVKD